MFEVTFLPIFIAGILNVVLGMVWYNPKVFGTAWMAGANVTPEMAERGKKKMPLMALIGLIAAMLVAYVMNHFGIAWGVFDWIGAVELAIWCWVGFVAPTLIGSVLWEMKPLKYYAINAGFWLTSFIVMALTLVWLS